MTAGTKSGRLHPKFAQARLARFSTGAFGCSQAIPTTPADCTSPAKAGATFEPWVVTLRLSLADAAVGGVDTGRTR